MRTPMREMMRGAARRRDRRLREALAEFERNELAFRMAEERRARLRRNDQGATNNQRRDENNTRAVEARGAEPPRNEETASNHDAFGQVQNGGEEAPRGVEQDETQPAEGATNNVEGSGAPTHSIAQGHSCSRGWTSSNYS